MSTKVHPLSLSFCDNNDFMIDEFNNKYLAIKHVKLKKKKPENQRQDEVFISLKLKQITLSLTLISSFNTK